jgi:hypothetical protein
MSCGCSSGVFGSPPGVGGGPGTSNPNNVQLDDGSIGDYLESSGFCLGCAGFWVIVVLLGIIALARSGNRG